MGMLFNTDDTVEILSILNHAFNRAGMARLRTDTDAPSAATFSTLGGAVDTYTNVCAVLGVDFDGGTGLRSKRWRKWLKKLDSIHQGAAGPGGVVPYVSSYIGKAIANAISNVGQTYSQVEFFAVPTPPNAGAPTISALAQDFKDKNGEYSLIITVTTSTVDQLVSGAFTVTQQVRDTDADDAGNRDANGNEGEDTDGEGAGRGRRRRRRR